MSQRPILSSGLKMLLTLASVVIVIAGFREAGAIILPILVAVFLAVICTPPVNWLQHKGVPDWLAVVTVFLGIFVVFVALSLVVTTSITSFQAKLPEYEKQLEKPLQDVSTWLHGLHGGDAPAEAPEGAAAQSAEAGQSLSPAGAAVTQSGSATQANSAISFVSAQLDSKRLTSILTQGFSAITMVLSNTFLVMLTVVFVLSEAAVMPKKLRAMAGDPDADLGWSSSVLGDLRAYLAVKTQCSLMVAIAVTIMLWLIGVDYFILWGLLAFFLNYIPNLGSIIAAIPPIILALITLGFGWAIVVTAGYVVFNFIVGSVLEPKMMGRRLGLSTLVVFLSMVFWGWVWGPVGMVLSVPLTMVVKILLEHTEDLKWVAILLGSSSEESDTAAS
ncbi:MAG: AI-2E family transporter [Phycisphaerales bacterium]|nr:AI-2E family transporter [Phycisphaerales bacterium]